MLVPAAPTSTVGEEEACFDTSNARSMAWVSLEWESPLNFEGLATQSPYD